jgi:hypothetical protein
VSEQETRQESFLSQDQEAAQECFPPLGQELFKNSCCRRVVKVLRVQPADFLPPKKLGRL